MTPINQVRMNARLNRSKRLDNDTSMSSIGKSEMISSQMHSNKNYTNKNLLSLNDSRDQRRKSAANINHGLDETDPQTGLSESPEKVRIRMKSIIKHIGQRSSNRKKKNTSVTNPLSGLSMQQPYADMPPIGEDVWKR